MVNIEFEALEAETSDDSSPLHFSEIIVNEGNILVNVREAKFCIGTPMPINFALYQNYPNPFNPETVIEYQLPQNVKVMLRIYDILGQEVKTLLNKEQKEGYYKVLWNGTNKDGMTVTSGIYFYCLEAGNFRAVRKMIRMR